MTAPASLPTRAECVSRYLAALGRASAEAAWTYAERGAMAVAEDAREPGGPAPEQVAQQYEALHARAVRQRTGAA
jgi:hypothetical protein